MALGHDVALIGLHGRSANNLEHQAAIYERMTYPLLQEVEGASPREDWGSEDRHDIFVFGPTGELLEKIEGTQFAHTPSGYDKLKQQLLNHLQ